VTGPRYPSLYQINTRVWRTGPAGRRVSRGNPDWRREFEETLPDLREEREKAREAVKERAGKYRRRVKSQGRRPPPYSARTHATRARRAACLACLREKGARRDRAIRKGTKDRAIRCHQRDTQVLSKDNVLAVVRRTARGMCELKHSQRGH